MYKIGRLVIKCGRINILPRNRNMEEIYTSTKVKCGIMLHILPQICKMKDCT